MAMNMDEREHDKEVTEETVDYDPEYDLWTIERAAEFEQASLEMNKPYECQGQDILHTLSDALTQRGVPHRIQSDCASMTLIVQDMKNPDRTIHIEFEDYMANAGLISFHSQGPDRLITPSSTR
jgi:hypothetical protein